MDDINDLLDEVDGDVTSDHVTTDDGTAIHYVRGGSGPTVLLVHGFPQDWYEWRRVMPRLVDRFDVVAVDLRGVGRSDAPDDGYDAAGLARDLIALVEHLGVGGVHVVGHDIGGWVAYAFARLRPDLTESAVVMETLIPGIEPDPAPPVEVPLWHVEFHRIPELPEILVQGRQAAYFRHFLEIGTADDGMISDAEIEHYAAAYGDSAHLRSAFEVYRAIPENAAFAAGHTTDIDVPLLLVGGEHVFGPAMGSTAARLRVTHGWSSIESVVIAGARHYLPEENPEEVADLVAQHAKAVGHQGPARTARTVT